MDETTYEKQDHIEFLKDTLIPDLMRSEQYNTAADIVALIEFVSNPMLESCTIRIVDGKIFTTQAERMAP